MKTGSTVYNILSLLFVLFALTACPAMGPQCVDADDWGQVLDKRLRIDPKQEFTYSGVTIGDMGQPLKVEITGEVDLCPTITPISISPKIKGWQDSGLKIVKGQKFDISVSGAYRDRNGIQKDGRGLYAYILPAGRNIADANGDWWYGDYSGSTSVSSSNRLAMDSATVCHRNPDSGTIGVSPCNPFFELYDNGTTGSDGSGYSGIAPTSGELYFRYARTADARGLSDSGNDDDRFSPWKGAYRWNNKCDGCRQTTITLSCMGALMFMGICIAAWEATCAGMNDLERAVSDWTNYQNSNCQEWYGFGPEDRTGNYWGTNGFDHWVKENYYTSSSQKDIGPAPTNQKYYPYNEAPTDAPGYNITVSNGCPGTFGKYLAMEVASTGTVHASETQVTQQTSCPSGSPSPCVLGTFGCTVGAANPGCTNVVQSGQLLKTTTYSIDSPPSIASNGSDLHNQSGNPQDMNSSGVNPDGSLFTISSPFVSEGIYDSATAPALGQLWFQIVDRADEHTTAHPTGGYYPDNVGSYEVHIITTKTDTSFSNFLSNIINPMRKIIFGYCRQSSILSAGNGIVSNTMNGVTQANCHVTGTPFAMYRDPSGNIVKDSTTSKIIVTNGVASATSVNNTPLTDYSANTGSLNDLSGTSVQYAIPFVYESNTSGTCTVSGSTPSPECVTDISGNPIPVAMGWQSGLTQRMYNILVRSSVFINVVKSVLVLLVVIYGMFFMMGLIRNVQEDFIKKIVKIGVILALISPFSWWFFYNFLFSIFIDGMDTIIAAMAGGFMGLGSSGSNNLNAIDKINALNEATASIKANPFAFVDGTMTQFFNGNTLIKIIGLLFASPVGFVYIGVIIISIFYFLWAILAATILYIICMLAISLLLIVGPIFMIFMLFHRTKNYFERWIKSLIAFILQPVLVFTALAIFNVFVYSALYTLLHYRVCWDDVFSINIPFGALGTAKIPLFKFYVPDGSASATPGSASNMPIGFFLILIFTIICNAMLKFIDYMAQLGAHLAISADGVSLGDSATSILGDGLSIMKDVAGKAAGVVKGAASAAGGKKD